MENHFVYANEQCRHRRSHWPPGPCQSTVFFTTSTASHLALVSPLPQATIKEAGRKWGEHAAGSCEQLLATRASNCDPYCRLKVPVDQSLSGIYVKLYTGSNSWSTFRGAHLPAVYKWRVWVSIGLSIQAPTGLHAKQAQTEVGRYKKKVFGWHWITSYVQIHTLSRVHFPIAFHFHFYEQTDIKTMKQKCLLLLKTCVIFPLSLSLYVNQCAFVHTTVYKHMHN